MKPWHVNALMLVVGLALGIMGMWRRQDAAEQRWLAARAVAMGAQKAYYDSLTGGLLDRLRVRERTLDSLRRDNARLDSLWRAKAGTLAVALAEMQHQLADTGLTIAACRAGALTLLTACEDAAAAATQKISTANATIDTLTAQETDTRKLLDAAKARVAELTALVQTAPVGTARKWLGFLPRPVVVLGIGCSGGRGIGCGGSVTVGFPLTF